MPHSRPHAARAAIVGLACLWVVGCKPAVTSDDRSSDSNDSAEVENVCSNSSDNCQCLAPDDTWCFSMASEIHTAEEAETECGAAGGVLRRERCPTKGLVGSCEQIDDCYGNNFYFYPGYAGGMEDWTTIAEARADCEAGTSPGCADWSEPSR
ncbi:MAG: hypothetical protein KC912_26715 [Proteobacteria bacterium]|nr:hypothetical protein [Pseudomonadota bacterium]